MLNHNYFYHSCIKNVITIFGAIFSDIYIKRSTGDGYEFQEIKVPLSYAPKQRALVRLKQNPNIDVKQAEITLPRIAYEIVSMNYDPARKISPASQSRNMQSNQPNSNFAYQMNSPTPYDVHINLYAYAKNQDDALQIVEQIFPFFNPDLNVTINAVPEMNFVENIPIILDSVSYEDDYEGNMETRRAIIWTLSFTAKMNFYGPITSNGIVKSVHISVSQDEYQPNNNLLKYGAEIDPKNATINDPYTVVEQFLYGQG